MSQHDMDIANAANAVVRADLNLALKALVSNSSGAAEPTTMYAYQFWADTTTGLLKQRNAANSAWITLGLLATLSFGSPFVQAAGVAIATTPVTLNAAQVGSWFNCISSASVINMPAVAGVPLGNCYTFRTAVPITLTANGAETISTVMNTSATTFAVNAGQIVSIVANGSGWFVIAQNLSLTPRTIQIKTSGTSYTTPAGCVAIKVRLYGAGGGGGGAGTGSPTNGSIGGNTTFNASAIIAYGGAGGASGTNGSFGAIGGVATGGDFNGNGATSQNAMGNTTPALYNAYGPSGANSLAGGGGQGGANGGGAGQNASGYGAGGGGAGGTGTAYTTGVGGAAGGYSEKIIVNPAASYSYAIGAGGTAGGAGTGGGAGGIGSQGLLVVEEYYA